MRTKVVIFGSRNYCIDADLSLPGQPAYDNRKLEAAFALLDNEFKNMDVEIICGLANGADMVGYFYALARNLPLWQFPADWDQHGKRAGMIRNGEMRKIADYGVGFWDGVSRGTGEMYRACTKENIKCIMFDLNNNRIN